MSVDKAWGSNNSNCHSKTSIFTIFENFIWYATCNIIVFESIVAYQDKRGNFGGID
jgi:hypothetical protein